MKLILCKVKANSISIVLHTYGCAIAAQIFFKFRRRE